MPHTETAWPFVQLAAVKSTARYVLGFKPEPVSRTQARFHHRYTLEPVIDMKAYTCRAVIDWLDVRVVLGGTTQGRWIHEEIERATADRAHADDDLGGIPGRQFIIRFQDPLVGQVKRALDAVAARWKIEQPSAITGIEISFDARPREYSKEALARLFGVVVRTHLPTRDVLTDRNDHPRFAWGQSKTQRSYVLDYRRPAATPSDEILLRTDLDLAPAFDATYYAGGKNTSCSWRTMVKLIDQQNKATGTMRILPESEHRLRHEVTLLGLELGKIGIKTLDDLAAFSFQKFQGLYFKFFLPTFEQPDHRSRQALRAITEAIERPRREKFLTTGVVGLEAMDDVKRRERKSVRKGSKKSTRPLTTLSRSGTGRFSTMVQYEALTDQVIYALRHLGNRQRETVR